MSDNTNTNTNTNNTDTEKMSLKEREDWLKARGVQIENPGEDSTVNGSGSGSDSGSGSRHISVMEQLMNRLKMTDHNQESSSSNNNNDNDDEGIPFVFVPADDSRPFQTLFLPKEFAKANVGDALPNYVKPYFGTSEKNVIDASLLQEQASKHFVGGGSLLGGQGQGGGSDDLAQLAQTKLTPAAMNAVTAQGSVETFPLVRPADTNKFQGVYIYLDEVGMLKKLPQNIRASQMAEACGYSPRPIFYGDVFLGRVQTKPVMSNVKFVAGVDTDRSTATWMQRAISENVAWQQEMNNVTGQSGRSQPDQIGTEGKAAVEKDFEWTQDDDELEIVVTATKWDKKAIKVVFLPRAIKIKYNGEERLSIPSLYGAIDVDGCTWTLDGVDKLVLTCEKASSGEMWPRIKA